MTAVTEPGCDLLCLDLPRAEALRRSRIVLEASAGAARARALADLTRLAMAAALEQGGKLCVCDLSWVMERAQNLVSHHLRVLREAGLAAARREGKTVLYSLTEEGRCLLEAVLERPAAPVR